MDSVHQIAEENVAKIRNMALILRPSMLDEFGLVPALRWHAKEVTRRTGLPVRMLAEDVTDDLPDSHRTCVYRVVQEAVHNCVKHSGADQVQVRICREPTGLSVTVEDNGTGFDTAKERGLGLLGMAERVSRLGGRLEVRSHAGEGTVVTTYLPIQRNAGCAVEAGVA